MKRHLIKLVSIAMNSFLEETKHSYQNILLNPKHYNCLRVVLSNESCDLDSAVSALVYGFVLHHEGIQDNRYKSAVLPLLNIPHDDLPIKTEVTYFLQQNGIDLQHVPTRGFRDLLDLNKVHEAGVLELTLVDHHNLSLSDEGLKSSVVEVIDHRPLNPSWQWRNISNVTIESVGSCCSLLARKIKEKNPHLMTQEIARLLLGPILLDTVNLSPSAGRITALDLEMVSYLETIVTVDRKALFDGLVRAKGDIASLTTAQVLAKDMKVIGGVPIAGAPVLIDELRKRADLHQAVTDFLRVRKDAPVAILMGVNITGEVPARDLAIFGKQRLVESILEALRASYDPALDLVEVVDHGVASMRLFRQGNVKATRKHIGPVVARVAAGLQEVVACGLG